LFIQQLLSVNPAARLGGSHEKLKSHQWLHTFNWNRLISRQLKPPFVPSIPEITSTSEISQKSIQDFILDLEDLEDLPNRKLSLSDSEGWDNEF
jgi:cGMP-dependent protein kinase